MDEWPTPLKSYIFKWLTGWRPSAYILLNQNGQVLSWGGALDALGIPSPSKGDPIAQRLIFMEGLLPADETLQLPLVKTGANGSLDVHLFKTEEGYALWLMDASDRESQLSPLQQYANRLALQRGQDSREADLSAGQDVTQPLKCLFHALGIAALDYGSDGLFRFIGKAPPWIEQFYPDVAGQLCSASPQNGFSVLENFMDDAYAFWSRQTMGCVKSGLWIEEDTEGGEHLFEATAVNTGASKILLIAHDICTFTEKQRLIQKGRELALDRSILERMRQELQAARDALEERVKERTAALEQANTQLALELRQRKKLEQERAEMIIQLQQSQKMEAIGTLAGGIAHDFNNILSAVLGFTELSLSEISAGTILHHNLHQVLQAALRAKDLVRQILTFSRQSKTDPRPIQFGPIIEEALNLLRATLPANINIRHDLRSETYVMADATQLHQVIINLCANAGHALQANGGLMEVILRDRDDCGREVDKPERGSPSLYVELTVKDTGMGMTAEIIKRICDPFFTTKEIGQGTGMGLAVVNSIVKSCRGSLSVSSEPGKGSIFRILLPAIPQTEIPRAIHAAKLATGHEHILFVDDEPFQTELAVQILGRLGYRITATTDCSQALAYLAENPGQFDLVITDMNMPKMSGKALASEIVKIQPDIPIILCSGYSDPVTKPKTGEFGIKEYLMKPIAMHDMADTIRRVLDNPT